METEGSLWIIYRAATKLIPKEITPTIIVQQKLDTVQALLKYFQKEIHKTEEPLEAIMGTKVLEETHQITNIQTTEKNSLSICRKFIRDQKSNNVYKGYFITRKIDYSTDIFGPQKLAVCLADIKDSTYQVEEFNILSIRSIYRKSAKQAEIDIQGIILQFLCSSFRDEETYKVYGKYAIHSYTDEHTVEPDHVILQGMSGKVVLICEDKKDDMEHATFQLFDQLITYSFSDEGKQQKYIYGIATTLSRWRFCCYININFTNNNVTKNNFLVSNEIGIELEQQIPTNAFIQNIVQIIRGCITKDIGQIIMQRLNL